MHELTREEAFELVAELQERRVRGEDDLALISFLCNRYRIRKDDAREIYNSFYLGFQYGADQILNTGSVREAASVDDVVFHAASEMSDEHTQGIIDEKKRAASGCGDTSAIIILAIFFVLRSTIT